METITILCKKVDGNITRTREVIFDPVYGDQSKPRSFKWGVVVNDELFLDTQAYQILDGISFTAYIPVIPVIPPKYLTTHETVWKIFPDNLPTIQEEVYKVRNAIDRNKIYFLEYKSEEQIQQWYALGVYDFCKLGEKDTYSRTPNPTYYEVMAERTSRINDFLSRIKDPIDGVLLVPICYTKYAGCPDTEGWEWYLVDGKDKAKIAVVPGLYPTYKWVPVQDLVKHDRYSAMGSVLEFSYSHDKFIRTILGI